MTFLAATPAVPTADTLTYEMPATPRLVEPAPIQDRAIYTIQVHETCGTFLAPDATHCPVCAGQCGGPCCGGTR